MGEFELIERYFKRPPQRAQVGVGDDCAIWMPTPGQALAISRPRLRQKSQHDPQPIMY